MKQLALVLLVAATALLDASLSNAQSQEDQKPEFNSGDLSGEDLNDEEEDGLNEEEREMFYRASDKTQLETHAKKRVQVVANKSMKARGYQYITVSVDGVVLYDAPISTAWERQAKGKTRTYFAYTPVGKFFPDGMQLKRFSNLWQVWLHHVIRFSGGVWIHATTPDHFAEIGAPASGGCVRVHPADAKAIYEIVEKFGMNETAITVLPSDKIEKQIPWVQLKAPMPSPLLDWRKTNNVK